MTGRLSSSLLAREVVERLAHGQGVVLRQQFRACLDLVPELLESPVLFLLKRARRGLQRVHGHEDVSSYLWWEYEHQCLSPIIKRHAPPAGLGELAAVGVPHLEGPLHIGELCSRGRALHQRIECNPAHFAARAPA